MSVKLSMWYICTAHFTQLYTLHRKCVHWWCLWSYSTSMLSWSEYTTNSNSNLMIDHVPTTNTKWMLDLSILFPKFLLLFSVFKISLFKPTWRYTEKFASIKRLQSYTLSDPVRRTSDVAHYFYVFVDLEVMKKTFLTVLLLTWSSCPVY